MRIAVVGGGAIGLCTAWHLRNLGADVSVYEMREVGNGASWGNAGQILPAKSVPLSEPGNLKFALKSFFKKNSPVTAPNNLDPLLIRYLLQFVKHSSKKEHAVGSKSMWQIGKFAFDAYQYLENHGVQTTRIPGPFTTAFKNVKNVNSLVNELHEATDSFPDLKISSLNQDQLLSQEPLLDERFSCGVRLENQFYINPPQFLRNISDSLHSNGVAITTNKKVRKISSKKSSVALEFENGKTSEFDGVVITTGAWLHRLAAEHGVSHPVIAGIGYSLSVDVPHQTRGMLYLPETRLATTNYKNALRISTFMQMTDVETPFSSVRMERLVALAKTELPKADWRSASEFWSGGRPLSGDGKPLIGATKSKGVYVNSGHGMWGITLAPISGKFIAEAIIEGRLISKDFDPLR